MHVYSWHIVIPLGSNAFWGFLSHFKVGLIGIDLFSSKINISFTFLVLALVFWPPSLIRLSHSQALHFPFIYIRLPLSVEAAIWKWSWFIGVKMEKKKFIRWKEKEGGDSTYGSRREKEWVIGWLKMWYSSMWSL